MDYGVDGKDELPRIIEAEGQVLLKHEVLELFVGCSAVVETSMEEQRCRQVLADLEIEGVLPLRLHVVMPRVACVERRIVEETRLVGDVFRDRPTEIDCNLRSIVVIVMMERRFSLFSALLLGNISALLKDRVIHDVAEVVGNRTDVDGKTTTLLESLRPIHTERELPVGGREEG